MKALNKTTPPTNFVDPDLGIDKFSGTHPDQHAESSVKFLERKMNSALGDAPTGLQALTDYTFREKALFFSFKNGPAAEGLKI